MSELQPFEKITDLRDSILYAANNWKVNKGWTNHLAIINRLCKEREQMHEILKELLSWSAHFPPAMDDEISKAKQLIQQETTIK